MFTRRPRAKNLTFGFENPQDMQKKQTKKTYFRFDPIDNILFIMHW